MNSQYLPKLMNQTDSGEFLEFVLDVWITDGVYTTEWFETLAKTILVMRYENLIFGVTPHPYFKELSTYASKLFKNKTKEYNALAMEHRKSDVIDELTKHDAIDQLYKHIFTITGFTWSSETGLKNRWGEGGWSKLKQKEVKENA